MKKGVTGGPEPWDSCHGKAWWVVYNSSGGRFPVCANCLILAFAGCNHAHIDELPWEPRKLADPVCKTRIWDTKFPNYTAIEPLLQKHTKEIGAACVKLLIDNLELFKTAYGSSHNHQAWEGGYLNHVAEVMNIACALFETLDSLRPLPFKLADALIVLFLHDIEKPWKYTTGPEGQRISVLNKEEAHVFRAKKLQEYGITLTPAQENALKYVEGEFNDYTPKRRVMNELAAFCHLCDVTSARIWHDYPAVENDPWAYRGRDSIMNWKPHELRLRRA